MSFSFDIKPLYQENKSDIIYFHSIVDMMTGETSIIKLFTDTFDCYEIYQSRFRVVHMNLQQIQLKDKTPVISKDLLWRSNEYSVDGSHVKMINEEERKQSRKNKEAQDVDTKNGSGQYYISLLSQSKVHINIEVIKDQNKQHDSEITDNDGYPSEKDKD